MGSFDCFRNVLQMEMAWPHQTEGLDPAWSIRSRKVRRTPPILEVSLHTKKRSAVQSVKMCPMPMF